MYKLQYLLKQHSVWQSKWNYQLWVSSFITWPYSNHSWPWLISIQLTRDLVILIEVVNDSLYLSTPEMLIDLFKKKSLALQCCAVWRRRDANLFVEKVFNFHFKPLIIFFLTNSFTQKLFGSESTKAADRSSSRTSRNAFFLLVRVVDELR